jgi:SAM-dependent methyltransferase
MTLRRPHAVLDLPSRQHKALKIERLLTFSPDEFPVRILEIGCGSGGISHYFATHPELDCVVDAVDVVDNRLATDGYRFQLVDDIRLPFEDHSFDVVITNHVIEHVGERAQQMAHLAEIRRIMKPSGRGYLAVPNRWQVVEPHYQLAFLSWMPRPMRTPYLKLAGKGAYYDCEPLAVPELEDMLVDAGFAFENVCMRAMRLMFEIERPQAMATTLLRRVPDFCFRPMKRLIPTLIYLFRPGDGSHGEV